MYLRTSTLIAALYFVGCVVIFLAGYLLFAVYPPSGSERDAQLALMSAAGERSSANYSLVTRRLQTPYASARRAKARQRLDLLEATLDKRSAMLEQATSSLNQKRAECRALQAELDETITFVFDLLAEGVLRRGSAPPASDQPVNGAAGTPKSELETLRNELRTAAFLEREQAEQIEELKAALLEAEAEIRATQTEAEQEIANLMEERQSFESAASEVVIRTGAAAAPALAELLEDNRPDVRSWAGFVLGKIGPDARGATPATPREGDVTKE